MIKSAPYKRALVTIAAFNEGGAIASVLPRIPRQIGNIQLDILVVDDASTDDTAQLVRQQGVRVITMPQNVGKTHAMAEGFKLLMTEGYDVALTMDADGQHDPAFLEPILKALFGGYEVVFTSRYHADSRVDSYPPMDRFLLNVSFASLIRKITGMNVTDPACGMRGFSDRVIGSLHLCTSRYGMEMETVLRVWQMPDIRWTELPIPMIYQGGGKISGAYHPDLMPHRLERFGVHAGDIMAVLHDMGITVPDLVDQIHHRNGCGRLFTGPPLIDAPNSP